MQSTFLRDVSIEELKALIKETMLELLEVSQVEKASRSTLRNPQKQFLPREDREVCTDVVFLSRKEASQFLKISLVTLHNWSITGVIQSYRIGTRIRYKKDELENAVQQVQNLKHKWRAI